MPMGKLLKIVGVVDGYVKNNSQTMKFLELAFKEYDIDFKDVVIIACSDPDTEAKDITPEYLQQTFRDEIKHVGPFDILIPFGNNALCSTGITKQPKGINSHRRKIIDHNGMKVCATISPHLVMREPQNEDEFFSDLAFAVYGANEPSIIIRDLETPEDFDDLIASAKRTQKCAYDYETTGLNPDRDVVVSAGFCTGEKEGESLIAWFWAPFDKLVERFTPKILKQLIAKLRELFRLAKKGVDFIGHNANFDDWNTEVVIGERFAGSTFDTMILKWNYDNVRPHGLKDTVAKYLGIPEYDKVFSDRVKAIKKRRGNNLTHEEDFFVLKWLGVEPNVKVRAFKKKGEVRSYTWPETVDKGTATYAMCEFETIREYNAKDAVYTLMLFDLLGPKIEDENLGFSCDFRHTIAKEFMRMEQRGQFFDLETAIAMEKEAQEIEDRVKKELLEEVARVSTPRPGTKTDEFNPGSNPDILWVLFGEIGKVPIIDRRKTMFANRLDKESLDKICDKVERNVYGDFSEVRDMLRSGEFEYLLAQEFLEEEFIRITGEQGIILHYDNKLLGLGNLAYDPVAVSLKTGEPGAGKTNLLLMQHQKTEPFINLLLMFRKVNKIRKTFLCKIMKSLDSEGLTRTSYRATGTDSGRGSSSGNYNAQNFPKFTRGIIRPRPGKKFLEMDLKAAEVRMLAAYCQDPELLKAIYAEDTHRAVGAIIFGCKPEEVTSDQRKAAKITVFLTIYGGGADKLSRFLGIEVSRAQQIIDDFRARFTWMDEWMEKQKELAKTSPYYIYTPWGTRRTTKNILSNDKKTVAKYERISCNSPIQGGAGELCFYYGCEIMAEARRRGYSDWFNLVNQFDWAGTVHDSLMFEVDEDLIWRINERWETNAKGEQEFKYEVAGPIWDMVKEIIDRTVDIPPLDTVRFEFDVELNDYWSCKPDLKKALDSSSNPEEKFLWELIKPELAEDEDKKELAEFFDEEEVIDF